jgi:hypothetical protein
MNGFESQGSEKCAANLANLTKLTNQRTHAIGQGMQLVQVESSGNSIAETFDSESGSSSRATGRTSLI